MDDLSGRTVSSEIGDMAGTGETRPDRQSDEGLSDRPKGRLWSRLTTDLQIEIAKRSSNNCDKLNLLCAYPELLLGISSLYPHDNANEGKGTEAEPSSNIHIKYLSEKKMFWGEDMARLNSEQSPRIFGLKHNEVMLVGLDSKSEHTNILLSVLRSTSTTTQNLDFDANEVDFQMVLAFVEVLKPISLELNFNNSKREYTLNEFVEAAPALFELDELTVFGPVRADGDSLFNYFPKFPPSLCFTSTSFLHTGDIVKFLGTLVSTKFEKGSAAATALKRIVNWTFETTYRTETEEGETMRGCKLLSELVADIIPRGLGIVNLDSAMSVVKRRIFELHLTVGGEQHVIYVKEEVNSADKYRPIQLANQTANFCKILDSPTSSITLDTNEQMLNPDDDPDSDMNEEMFNPNGDPDSDMVDSDEEDDEFEDDGH